MKEATSYKENWIMGLKFLVSFDMDLISQVVLQD